MHAVVIAVALFTAQAAPDWIAAAIAEGAKTKRHMAVEVYPRQIGPQFGVYLRGPYARIASASAMVAKKYLTLSMDEVTPEMRSPLLEGTQYTSRGKNRKLCALLVVLLLHGFVEGPVSGQSPEVFVETGKSATPDRISVLLDEVVATDGLALEVAEGISKVNPSRHSYDALTFVAGQFRHFRFGQVDTGFSVAGSSGFKFVINAVVRTLTPVEGEPYGDQSEREFCGVLDGDMSTEPSFTFVMNQAAPPVLDLQPLPVQHLDRPRGRDSSLRSFPCLCQSCQHVLGLHLGGYGTAVGGPFLQLHDSGLPLNDLVLLTRYADLRTDQQRLKKGNKPSQHGQPGVQPSSGSLVLFLAFFFGGIVVSLNGWLDFDHERRFISAAWIFGGCLLSAYGIVGWLTDLWWL